jgi:hypothetical protein
MPLIPAEQRSHPEILDRLNGEWVGLESFLAGMERGDIVERIRVGPRMQLADGNERFVCPHCKQPMFLATKPVKRDEKRFYFKHVHDTGHCAGPSGLSATQINARKFNGVKESELHRRIKERLAASLEADPAFADIRAEERYVDEDGVGWRQPDVQGQYFGMPIAFEVQLSTTFLHVIAQRMQFYRRNHVNLLWLFRELDCANFRQSEDDLFYTNNRNAFRVTEETVEQSRQAGRFALECMWYEPVVTQGKVLEQSRSQVVFFDELTRDVSAQGIPRCFYFNYEAERQQAERIADGFALRQRFEAHWFAGRVAGAAWDALRAQLQKRGHTVSRYPTHEDGFHQLLDMLYSVKHGRVVGYRYSSLVEIAHYLYDRRKGFLRLFHHALSIYGGVEAFKASDTGKSPFSAKVAKYREHLATDPEFAFDTKHAGLVAFLFPEIPESRIR